MKNFETELPDGAVYKIMTKRKLKFGLTLTVAFCGDACLGSLRRVRR